jgi:hypothetical protein
VATRRRPTERDTVRALWLLGLRDPQGVAEIRQAWKDRVARTHPDRRLEQSDAANRLTAAFNDARDICERWAESGLPWPEPKRRRVIRLEEPDEGRFDGATRPNPPTRSGRAEPTPEEALGERRASLRPRDRVRLAGGDDDVWRVVRVTAETTTGPVLVELEGGDVREASELELAAFGCPVCGLCAGPAIESPGHRPCPECLTDLRRLERDPGSVDAVLRGLQTRARAGVRIASELGDEGLAAEARERVTWSNNLWRRPREERPGKLLAAFAHAFAVWGNVGI